MHDRPPFSTITRRLYEPELFQSGSVYGASHATMSCWGYPPLFGGGLVGPERQKKLGPTRFGVRHRMHFSNCRFLRRSCTLPRARVIVRAIEGAPGASRLLQDMPGGDGFEKGG